MLSNEVHWKTRGVTQPTAMRSQGQDPLLNAPPTFFTSLIRSDTCDLLTAIVMGGQASLYTLSSDLSCYPWKAYQVKSSLWKLSAG